MKSDQILDEYRKGDADKRVSMFLHYSCHRNKFYSMERDHPMDLDAAQPTSTPVQPGMLQRMLFTLHNGFGC